MEEKLIMKLNRVIIYIVLSILILYTIKYIGSSNYSKIIPKNRKEMKHILEKTKLRKSSLPFDNPDTSVINNKLSRKMYLPESWYSADFKQDPSMTIPYDLKTQCFWVVSRVNNCYYCLGHQEHKLSLMGFSDSEIAALDYMWEKFDIKTVKSLQLAKKITLYPHIISEEDINTLRTEFTDNEIIELVFTISMFNSVNRWTDGIGLPQDLQMKGSYIDFSKLTSEDSSCFPESLCIRKDIQARSLPTLQEIIPLIKTINTRKCRVKLISIEETSRILDIKSNGISDLERVLATFPIVGKQQYDCLLSIQNEGSINTKTKLILQWTTARHNGSIFSLSKIYKKLSLLNYNLDDIENPKNELDKTIKIFTIKLTEFPQFIYDNDIKTLKKYFNDKQIAEIIYMISSCNMIDRLSESLFCSYPD